MRASMCFKEPACRVEQDEAKRSELHSRYLQLGAESECLWFTVSKIC